MEKNSLITSVTHTKVDVRTGRQKTKWVEIQLVDERNEPVANMPWIAESSHPVSGRVDNFTYSGQSDAQGLIRINMPHGFELKLTLDGNMLAEEMEKRSLRVGRNPKKDSVVRSKAEENGYIWHYAVIGELCRTLPDLLRNVRNWPPFHFPHEKLMKGAIIKSHQLQHRHVIEICPFRAWELVLHHQKDYSIANGINLGVAATLAYADENVLDKVSITHFFINQCRDLSRLPTLNKDGLSWNTLVQDVPFSKRYHTPVFMDTSKDTSKKASNKMPSEKAALKEEKSDAEKADGDTQLFYVYNEDKVIVAWRGTASIYDAITDVSFRPISPETCQKDKTQCTSLLPVGKVHTGFWNGYGRVERKYKEQLENLYDLMTDLKLFICGHSLGGALALIHAAKLRTNNPLLYTYGMPRTFTRDAVAQLPDITHYRHVNDNDPIPAVPPEANLDNELYKIWGPLGGLLGFVWSIGELMAYQMVSWGDCFWHHGNTVAFLTATQSREWKECKVSLPTPNGCIAIRNRLPVKAKLYLVPALADEEIQQAGKEQKEFKASLTEADLQKLFPKGQNHDRGINTGITKHFMTSYMPYIYNKLLELIKSESLDEKTSLSEHRNNIDLFKEQMVKNKQDIPVKEFIRNEIFLRVEDLLNSSLSPTLSMPYGKDTLLRFMKYSEEVIENV
ncbi:lipase family protein [Erwinia sp. CGal63]|uniref:lipase family protein n=1 Tax=Erwinia sp. CGal63 TaxID=2919889 RepID=UPI003009B375